MSNIVAQLVEAGHQDLAEDLISIVTGDKSGKGKCPESGCIMKKGDKWRIMSNKTGKLWPAEYDSKEDAEDALKAYHFQKRG